jgi:rRNA maturation RNase YbeY
MVKVTVYKQGNYPVSAKKIKDRIKKTLQYQGLTSDFEVSVALVDDTKMDELVKKYYHREGPDFGNHPHPILTFPTNELEGQFVFAPDQINDLGEMVISYPQAVQRAEDENTQVEEVILDLAEHGALHLAGIHH